MIDNVRVFSLAALTLAALVFAVHCSEKDKGTTPTQQVVEMNGALSFPDPDAVDMAEVSVGFGDYESLPDSAGSFRIKGNGGVVGVAMAYTAESVPMLMQVCPNPSQNQQLDLTVRSTAMALAFLDPLICLANPTDATLIIQRLEGLTELDDLEDLLADKLSINPLALGVEDAEIDSTLSRLAMAYFNSYPEDVSRKLASLTGALPQDTRKPTADPPEIDPSYTFGGLKLTWEGGSTYKITNSYGRWCYCCTPTDTLFIFPNGDMLDWIVKDRPFPPSERNFHMSVVAGKDTARVNLFGYGFWSNPTNNWDNLTPEEKSLAHIGGITTVVMELFTQVVSAVCNVPRAFGNEKVAQLWKKSGWDFLVSDSRVIQRIEAYIRANNPTGCAWWLTKQVISRAVTSAEYRATLAQMAGITLTDGMLKKLGGWLLVPAKVVIASNNLSSVFKTVLGLSDSYHATRFKVWRDFTAFGAISGQVATKSNGVGIQGAIVKITGDENNPLNPPHEKTTDAQGYFRFENIGVGERSITASKTGYNSATVGVTVVENKTVTANLQLEVQSGGLSGKVLNDIYTHNSVSPANFTGTVDITANEIGGQHRVSNSFAFDGTFSLNLPVGSWWVVASHDDYKPDSFSVVIPADGNASPPRDLALVPDPVMTGQIYINTDNQGSYELNFTLNLSQV
ncbi:MAG: carboxypeptidase regulatory-like domain-containing protein, partial [Candidatus Zixiibacteriota bacterium]